MERWNRATRAQGIDIVVRHPPIRHGFPGMLTDVRGVGQEQIVGRPGYRDQGQRLFHAFLAMPSERADRLRLLVR